ncbi:acyl-CoA dehydrogenase family protein [Pseudohoeflea coraliihabitans]|uniref:Acyl-CoA dehydrogenase n=1 Tax=Pseudohoeflea coraliihabitans TaxID=2860393 RepID=A0ABS6WIP1_9HYPH|nr:acyl-CoA dehydrogenase [Pseudohoeflea sp. DP4N28-3]MBW3095812.1 acyl-CoA dehydrogenase [Pseudohoeflea sp. DP4N28-3]
MDFQFTERQQELVAAAREVGEKKLLPRVEETMSVEKLAHLRGLMAEQGLLGLNLPEAYGGLGLPLLDTLLVTQALQIVAPILGGIAHRSSTGAVGAIAEYGTDDQRERFVRPSCAGEIGISIGITEPEAGSAATAMTTRAVVEGDEVVLNGRKQFVSFVNYNQYTLVYCRFGTTGRGADIGAVIVPHDAPGFSHSSGTLNMADELLFELYFDDCRVPVENVLIDGGAFGKLISVYNAERLGSIARMIGSAEAAFDYALGYSKQRKQFNREISDFQGIQWMLADMRVKLDAAKMLCYRAAGNAGATGLPNPTETSIAKVFTAKAAKEICDDAIQILGANGYTKEYPLAHRYAEVRGGSIYGGSMQIHKNMIAAALLERRISQWKRD